MSFLSIPTTSALPSHQRIPASHPAVTKALQRLARPSLLSLALDWLDDRNQENTAPYLLANAEDEDDDQDFYPPASSLAALREIYTELQARKGSKRDVVDRILEGDWRDGISLYQLAMADMQYLYDHPSSQRWTAWKVVKLSPAETTEKDLPSIPRFHPATFLRNLQREALPDVKAHYNLDRHATLPLLILRIFILESPYNTSLALQSGKEKAIFDPSKTFYVAFPDFSPYIYVSLASSTSTPGAIADNRSLRILLQEGIPKAFSKPRERYKLESTSLSARNLDALVERRGGGRTNAAGGGWGAYTENKANEDNKVSRNPLNIQLPTRENSIREDEDDEKGPVAESVKLSMKRKRVEHESVVKRRKLIAQGRFGNSAKPDDGKGIERLDIRIEDPFPPTSNSENRSATTDAAEPEIERKRKGRRSAIAAELDQVEDDFQLDSHAWRPDVRITFHGQHIFAGVRELVEAGIINGEKMPGWMTGEEGVSIGVVRDGRIKGFKGSGV